MSYGLSTWETVIGVAVVFYCYLRMLCVLDVDGKLDRTAFLTIRSASLLPLGVMLTAMVLAWFVLTWIGAAAPVVPWVSGVLAVSGSVWACERGVRAVQRQRRLNLDELCAHLARRATLEMCCLERQNCGRRGASSIHVIVRMYSLELRKPWRYSDFHGFGNDSPAACISQLMADSI